MLGRGSSWGNRREFIASTCCSVAATLLAPRSAADALPDALAFGPWRPFDFQALVERSCAMAEGPYNPPRPPPAAIDAIDYDAHGRIRFRPECALNGRDAGCYPITFFHVGRFFSTPVRVFEVVGERAREVQYSPSYFRMPAQSPARELPPDMGFAGFRIHETHSRADWATQDWLAFLGASYFRAIGSLGQYGLSARGLAVNTTAVVPEEFPRFSEFYIQTGAAGGEPTRICALLEGPSVCGAYCFVCRREGGVVMDVDAEVFVRSEVEQLGLAPLTSMYWYGETLRGAQTDWRPEVHDSDGLALWTGAGERIWRPLNNPANVVTSSFFDDNPRGFGLLQRDRDFEHYLDGVNYQSRPSLWVEPRSSWGAGAVTLVEIPTDDEIHDNVVAFWTPATRARAGQSFSVSYRLSWQEHSPHEPAGVARVVATRIGRGGEAGKPRPAGVTKFVVEFAGPAIEQLDAKRAPQATASASRGAISAVTTQIVPNTRRWRAQFDLAVGGAEPVELRLYLRSDANALSETWLYQFDPRPRRA